MTIVQFISAMERYSVDVLFLGIAVCLITSIIKKIIPTNKKKYMTFVPFLTGCIVYGLYMFFTDKSYNIFSMSTVVKGIESGAAATIYYVMFEQFVRGKKSLIGLTDTKQLAIAGILKEIVTESYLYSISVYLAEQLSSNINDIPYCTTVCLNTLNGKTLPGVNETDIIAASRLITSTLSVIK